MMNEVKCLLLLAKVYKSHKKEDVMETLHQVTGQGLYFLRAAEGAGLAPQSARATGRLHLSSFILHLCSSVMAGLGWARRARSKRGFVLMEGDVF